MTDGPLRQRQCELESHFFHVKKTSVVTDASASVLVTVSVCRSKALIGAAIWPRSTSAACQTEMEGI